MREKSLIRDGSVCEGDFINGVDSIEELRQRVAERERCTFFPKDCPLLRNGPGCIPRAAHEVAMYTIKLRTSVAEELVDFEREVQVPTKGYFDPYREAEEETTQSRAEITERVGKWAEKILGIQSVDADSHNHEYTVTASQLIIDRYSVLQDSVHDPENNMWVHSCGARISEAQVFHPLHLKAMPYAGSGRVKVEHVPYCSSCQEKPSGQGTVLFEEDEDRAEIEALRFRK